MIINKIQKPCIRLFQINRLVVCKKFFRQTMYFQKHLTHNAQILKYGSQIKIVNH